MYTKEQVRKWMQERQKQHVPPPSIEDIKRQLGHGFKQDRGTR